LSCSSPISDSERPDSQANSALKAGWSFLIQLTAPHSSNHKDSQMLRCNIRESNMQSERHFSRRQRALCHQKKGHFLYLLKTWGALTLP
jgi:hypothetical protein